MSRRKSRDRGKEGKRRVKGIVTALVLGSLWLLLSGIYKPLILGFGAGSVLAVVLLMARMDRTDGYVPEWHLKPVAFLAYLAWLMKEIARANWAVTRVILSPRMRLRQHLFAVPVTSRSDLAQVTFANSITLTPGTVTIETEPGRFLVHALNYGDETPGELAEMDARVAATEHRRG